MAQANPMNLWIFYAALTSALLLGVIGLHGAVSLSRSPAEPAPEQPLPVGPSPENQAAVTSRLVDAICHAPGLDVVVAYFTLLPNLIGVILAGGWGFGVAIAAQVTALLCWMIVHEFVHYRLWQGPKISRTLGRIVGNWRNHLVLWTTVPALSAFWLVRLYELLLYPVLVATVRFPRYEARDWVNVSRHKFDGLVGYGLVWCLYCDWMTGVQRFLSP